MRASEAAAIADLVIQTVENRPLTDDVRARLGARATTLGLQTIEPHMGSLVRDPVHNSAHYLMVDAIGGDGRRSPFLLRLALASAPASSLFHDAVLIGRMRPGAGREVVVNAMPFASTNYEAIRAFAEQVDTVFLPRPQGALPAIATGNRHPEISLPAAFSAFRTVLKNTGVNWASTVQLSATREMTLADRIAVRDGENPVAAGHTRVSIEHLYHAGLWAAARAGWREGYTAEADHIIISGNTADEIARSIEDGKAAIRAAAGFTKFTTDTSKLFALEADTRHPRAWSDAQVDERFAAVLTGEEQRWVLDEFSRAFETPHGAYAFSPAEIRRLAVKFGPALKLNEDLYDSIRAAKAQSAGLKQFDFEPSLDEADTLTTAKELLFAMQWLKARGRAAQLVPPNLGFKKRQAYPETMAALHEYVYHKMWPELEARVAAQFAGKPVEELRDRVEELAQVARYFNATLSIHSGSGKQAAVLEQIGRATSGRVNYKISGELQLQLFDVISEQEPASSWRQLYDRMVARCNAFAAGNAFGEESALAEKYLAAGRGSYLGKAELGRTDNANLFLVFWLGNLVGSRDIHSADGDTRFFKEKLDELPPALLDEVRSRNARYIVWLTDHLRG
jgi:hypothetical protein